MQIDFSFRQIIIVLQIIFVDCERTFEHWQHVETVQPLGTLIQSDTLLSTSSYLLLPIIAIVLIVSAVIGLLCFRRYLRIRKEEINLYVNPQHDDSSFLKSIDSGVTDNIEKEICHDNPSCDNIILLYTNSSTSFMALMKDFRKTLAKMCSCSVSFARHIMIYSTCDTRRNF